MPSPDNTKPFFPLAGLASDGWSKEDRATATCFCGAVQLEVPLTNPGLVATFVCNCADCHKITASMFASNFTVLDTHLKHIRGRENLSQFKQDITIGGGHTGRTMENFFCKTCGSLMYRVGSRWPGMSILRIGSVDDFTLHETILKPQIEFYTDTRAKWLHDVDIEGIPHVEGMGPA